MSKLIRSNESKYAARLNPAATNLFLKSESESNYLSEVAIDSGSERSMSSADHQPDREDHQDQDTEQEHLNECLKGLLAQSM